MWINTFNGHHSRVDLNANSAQQTGSAHLSEIGKMESRTRSIVKAISWQLVGLVTMTVLAYFATGDWQAAGGLALGAAGLGFICFILHERLWARISWGRR